MAENLQSLENKVEGRNEKFKALASGLGFIVGFGGFAYALNLSAGDIGLAFSPFGIVSGIACYHLTEDLVSGYLTNFD